MTNLTIGKGVTFIDNCAFNFCTSLADIYYNGTTEEWENIRKHEAWDNGTGEYSLHCTDD